MTPCIQEHPAEVITVIEKYCTAVYGSNHWDLKSRESEMMTAVWKTGHKLVWNVPRACRTYLVQAVLAPHMASLRPACGQPASQKPWLLPWIAGQPLHGGDGGGSAGSEGH